VVLSCARAGPVTRNEKESNEDDAALDDEAWRALFPPPDPTCSPFLAHYEQVAPVSRRRVALWEALNLLALVLNCWTKIKPVRLNNTMLMLERHLSVNGM
jgi:hypothetical protein